LPSDVLFDFDFTLTDPTPWLIPAWTEALGSVGLEPPDPAVLRKVIGHPLRRQFRLLVGDGVCGPLFGEFERVYVDCRTRFAPERTVLLPDVERTLGALRAGGRRLGIVSTGTGSRIEAVLRRFGIRDDFGIVVAGAADKAAGIGEAIAALRTTPSHTAYVGDHPMDCAAAAQAGTAFFAVLTGAHTASDFPAGTTAIQSLAELVPPR
jgi:phosphoglycolate phosphatase-like HAD superfamily hydrolase